MDKSQQNGQPADYAHGLWLQQLLQRQQQQQLPPPPPPLLRELSEEQERQQQLVLHGGRMEYSVADIPPGYRFCPSDEVLILSYLIPKVNNASLPFDGIHSVYIYDYTPDELKSKYPSNRSLFKDNEWYFFTSRHRKYAKGTRPNRTAAKGYWKPTGPDQIINLHNTTTVIGYKKGLDYYNGHQRCGQRTHWKMHEYRIHQTGSAPRWNANGEMEMQLDEWVLCKIYSKKGMMSNNAGDFMNAYADRGQSVQTNEAVVENQNSSLVSPGPSTAPSFALPLAYEPSSSSSSFQMFDQNNSFIDGVLWPGLNDNMLPAVANLPPMTSGVDVDPNYEILASPDLSYGCMQMNLENGDADEADLSDIMRDVNEHPSEVHLLPAEDTRHKH